MNLDRLSRITDLFLEGREMDFGTDADGKPIVVWVGKLNSFEEEEARRDGSAARSLRMLALNDDNPEVREAREELSELVREELIQVIAAQNFDEDYLLAVDDVESDEEWKEKLSAMRMSLLLPDSEVPEDDPRHKQAYELNQEYLQAINDAATKRQAERQADCQMKDLDELQDLFVKNWKTRVGLSEFFAEQRVTQLFYSLRDCQAMNEGDGKYDHSRCKHTRLLSERSQVRSLPEEVLEKGIAMLQEITVDRRTAGNSDVPMSSSESSEQPKQAEESTPSIPKVTRPGAQAI
jgi:hypothetical protein